jgi:cytochrome c oxidase assembly protein subunit 15
MNTDPANGHPRPDGGVALLGGFAAALVMWVVGFVTKMPAIALPNPIVLAVLLSAPVAAAFLVVSHASRPVRTGMLVGVVAGGVNLLVLLSVIGREAGGLSPWWIPGSVLLQVALGAAGGWLGQARRGKVEADAHVRFALLTAVGTLVLISVGGAVTTLGVGLAVPDWPNTYGSVMFLYPLSKMVGGIYHEHAHRLFGSLIGLMTIVLAVWTWRRDDRAWVRWWGVGLLLLVVVQGVLGGLRVTEISTTLAAVHGSLAQTFFALTGALALFSSRAWRAGRDVADPALDSLRGPAVATLVLCVAQLGSGAALRHFAVGLHLHVTVGVLVALLAMFVGTRVISRSTRAPLVPWLGLALLTVVLCQIMLGVGAWMFTGADAKTGQLPTAAVLVTTGHVINGAVTLMLALLLTLQIVRCSSRTTARSPEAIHVPA